MKDFISVKDLSATEIVNLLEMANRFRENDYKISRQLFAANLFFEPSTRTKMSFIVAKES